MPRVLIVDDEPGIRRVLSLVLEQARLVPRSAATAAEALAIAQDWRPAVVLLDQQLPDGQGLDVLTRLLQLEPKPSVILITGNASIGSAVEAMRRGAFDYLAKPFDNDELLILVRRALELQHLACELEGLREELAARYGFSEIIGISRPLQEVFRVMAKVAPVDATVLTTGESGTGKELVARAIHRKSRRARGPFVAVNCSAIPESLVEAEFFGHEKGAFTDAQLSRPGKFEQADGGTLFLDEVCDLSLAAQAKLLRALQERQIVRLGAQTPRKVDVRVLAATNKDPEAEVKAGHFRDDLYWRLNVVHLRLPALRERREDLPLLIDHLMARFQRELGLPVRSIAPEARHLLTQYGWPGNIRELENTICRAMILCEGEQLGVQDLPARLLSGESSTEPDLEQDFRHATLTEAVESVTERLERMMIIGRLAEHQGSRTATAESLGISRKTLFNKMRHYGIGSPDFEGDEAN